MANKETTIIKILENHKAGKLNTEQAVKKLQIANNSRPKIIKEDPLLCHFSTRSGGPRGARPCTRVGKDAKKRGNCRTCRVAAEWEEVYG